MTLQIIDTTAPEGMEVSETSDAKNVAMDRIQDVIEHLLWHFAAEEEDVNMMGHDAISAADDIVEKLIAEGWRPTEETPA